MSSERFRPLNDFDQLDAAQLARLVDQVEATRRAAPAFGQFYQGAAGLLPGAPPVPPQFFPAELTQESSGTYAWREVYRSSLTAFSVLDGGRTGALNENAARELNATTGIATGTYVWMTESTHRDATTEVTHLFAYEAGTSSMPGAKVGVAGGSGQSISGLTWTKVTFAAPALYDQDNFFASANPTRLTTPRAAIYLAGATVNFGISGINNSSVAARIRLNNSSSYLSMSEGLFIPGAHFPRLIVTSAASLQAGDYLEFEVICDSDNTVVSDTQSDATCMWIHQIGNAP